MSERLEGHAGAWKSIQIKQNYFFLPCRNMHADAWKLRIKKISRPGGVIGSRATAREIKQNLNKISH